MSAIWWRKWMLDYQRDNRENIYTANDVVPEDMVILFKNEAGANWYDRIVPLSLIYEGGGGTNKYHNRVDFEVAVQGANEFTLGFEPSDIAMVFVAEQLMFNYPVGLRYTIVANIVTFTVGLNKYEKVTIIG